MSAPPTRHESTSGTNDNFDMRRVSQIAGGARIRPCSRLVRTATSSRRLTAITHTRSSDHRLVLAIGATTLAVALVFACVDSHRRQPDAKAILGHYSVEERSISDLAADLDAGRVTSE